MKMTWTLARVPGGIEVTIVCEDVPEGIRKEDHDAGLRSTLANLAAFTSDPVVNRSPMSKTDQRQAPAPTSGRSMTYA
jgi:hypothetical protein